MSIERITNLPSLAAMLILIAALLILQRRNPRIAIGSWLLALGLILASQVSWYFTWFGTPYYAPVHTFRLCVDLLTGIVFLIFTGTAFSNIPQSMLILFWNAGFYVALEVLYGVEVKQPQPYILCALCGAVISIVIAVQLRRPWSIPVAQVSAWIIIAAFALEGNYRASAYIGLAVVYGAAAMHIWFRLRAGSLGRIGITVSLALWAASFVIHPWVMHSQRFYSLAEEIWTMQKFVLIFAMLLFFLEEEIRENAQLAFHDQLTGLPNRRLMEKRLLATIKRGRTTVALMDIDGFKNVNDTLGHLAGDEILRQVASRLTAILDANETLARLGGDEFLIISNREPNALMQSISSSLIEPVIVEGSVKVNVRLSIGCSTFPDDAENSTGSEVVSRLLRVADSGMYGRKRNRQSRRAEGPA